jgi:ubiquinone/menaquinone biosynthesis C-methylase UbiE
LRGEKVIAIDPSKEELEEASTGSGVLKIVMNAKELKFLDNEFSTVTSFFTMMYIENEDKEKVFREIYRVLKPNGEFLLWDINIPAYDNSEKDIYAVMISIELENKLIETGYGIPWSERQQSIDTYINLGREVGFEAIEEKQNGGTYFIRFRK